MSLIRNVLPLDQFLLFLLILSSKRSKSLDPSLLLWLLSACSSVMGSWPSVNVSEKREIGGRTAARQAELRVMMRDEEGDVQLQPRRWSRQIKGRHAWGFSPRHFDFSDVFKKKTAVRWRKNSKENRISLSRGCSFKLDSWLFLLLHSAKQIRFKESFF